MEQILLGFELDISKYELKDIFFWLLIISFINLTVGIYIGRNQAVNSWFNLIRYKKLSKWWYRQCRNVFLLNLIFVLAIFCVYFAVKGIIDENSSENFSVYQYLEMFSILITNLALMGYVQLIMINTRRGEKLSFFIITATQMISLYGKIMFQSNISVWLPGSLMMYRRSGLYIASGFYFPAALAVQTVYVILICLFGHKLIKGRM